MKQNNADHAEFGSLEVAGIFRSYPENIRKKVLLLRRLILETASELGISSTLEETIKWGEPSYVAQKGSTIKIDWKESKPEQYAMYFHCQTKLN